jgi:formylglycine-generating enzyme required for sulfatase activity
MPTQDAARIEGGRTAPSAAAPGSTTPGGRARPTLPTEAEWEYACRAGTGTPFSFGETITPEQVNYDSDCPYAGGEKGLNRGETVPVKSLPPNAWGLYEMHGNVWEWCADGPRPYANQPEQDPTGPEDKEAHRAFRGGSWFASAGWARSAYRFGLHPGYRNDYLGFRLCLRSIEPGQAGSRPGRPVRAAPGGRRREQMSS